MSEHSDYVDWLGYDPLLEEAEINLKPSYLDRICGEYDAACTNTHENSTPAKQRHVQKLAKYVDRAAGVNPQLHIPFPF